MEAVEPVHGSTALLLIALGTVALLLAPIMKVTLHALMSPAPVSPIGTGCRAVT